MLELCLYRSCGIHTGHGLDFHLRPSAAEFWKCPEGIPVDEVDRAAPTWSAKYNSRTWMHQHSTIPIHLLYDLFQFCLFHCLNNITLVSLLPGIPYMAGVYTKIKSTNACTEGCKKVSSRDSSTVEGIVIIDLASLSKNLCKSTRASRQQAGSLLLAHPAAPPCIFLPRKYALHLSRCQMPLHATKLVFDARNQRERQAGTQYNSQHPMKVTTHTHVTTISFMLSPSPVH